jgi:hypothetical protein
MTTTLNAAYRFTLAALTPIQAQAFARLALDPTKQDR